MLGEKWNDQKGAKAANKNHITYRERCHQKRVPAYNVETNRVDDRRGFASPLHKEMALQEIEILGKWDIGVLRYRDIGRLSYREIWK